MLNKFDIYVRNVYNGESQGKLAKEYSTSRACINQIVSMEKLKRESRKNPKVPMIEDYLYRFDNEHNLNEKNGSIKIWRSVVRSLSYREHCLYDYSEDSENHVIDEILKMSVDEFLSVRGIGVVYADLLEPFKEFLKNVREYKELMV